jgi:hypothetical protein
VSISVNIHPEGFQAQSNHGTFWLVVQAGDGGDAAIFLSPKRCDELIEAATALKQLQAAAEGEGK